MSKISELGKISGGNTKSKDLFVTVNLDQGEDGTKNITRKELVNAIELEVFDHIKIDGGDYIKNVPIDNASITNSTYSAGTITDTTITDPNINVTTAFEPKIADTDYFYLKDVSTDKTVSMTYSQLYNEIATTSKKAKKIYLSTDGNDDDPGSYMKPLATLEKAVEMARQAAKTIAPGVLNRQIVHITVMPGTYYTNGNLALPDFCSMVSVSGQYTTTIVMNPGYENENCILLGSGCYVQGFSYFNNVVDNFDYPTKGFAYSFRPGARITRSPYVRDSSQISNYSEREIPPLLNPLNSRGTIEDLGFEITVSGVSGTFEVGDYVEANNGVTGYVSRVTEIGSGTIYIRNNIGDLEANALITSSSGGTATITAVGEEDFPNKEVGRGGGMILADRALVDQDSIFPYILAFGATPRTQNGLGYVAKNGAGINGISSLSIFSRCAFYALDGGQITLNNSGTQFGDISMRAKGSTPVFNPRETTATLVKNVTLADTIVAGANVVIDDLWDYLSISQSFQTYNSAKCSRDVGIILDGVGNDLVLGTNYWGVYNGISYRRGTASVVVDQQLTETAGSIAYLKSLVADLVPNSESVARTNASFDEIIDILNNGTTSVVAPGDGVADALTFSSTGNTNFDKARTLLLANKALITNAVISYITTNYPALTYNETKCRRDVGYIVDGFAHDLNYNSNIASIDVAKSYFEGTSSQLPLAQREPSASAYDYLGTVCSSIVQGTFTGQDTTGGVATATEGAKCITLASFIADVVRENSLQELPGAEEPDTTWVSTRFTNSREVIDENKTLLQGDVIAYINSEYDFLDEALTRSDALNLITSITNDFREGVQQGTRIFAAALFNYEGKHVFSVFNPTTVGLKYIGSAAGPGTTNLPVGSTVNVNDAYIVYSSSANLYDGTIYYWNGSAWTSDGQNDVSLLNAFTNSWDRIRDKIKSEFTLTSGEQAMLDGLIDDVLIASTRNPRILSFGSLVESLSHQFNLASAGVNVNALPLNFRRLGAAVSASTSVLQESGGRVRWSGADELNNQYFARGLRINGRTGRIEGRPFTSSVRKLARRASNSRAQI